MESQEKSSTKVYIIKIDPPEAPLSLVEYLTPGGTPLRITYVYGCALGKVDGT